MGRSDYLVSAGIGFDLDRSSAKKSIGIFESVAETIGTIATKSASKQFADTEKEYDSTVKKLQQINNSARPTKHIKHLSHNSLCLRS